MLQAAGCNFQCKQCNFRFVQKHNFSEHVKKQQSLLGRVAGSRRKAGGGLLWVRLLVSGLLLLLLLLLVVGPLLLLLLLSRSRPRGSSSRIDLLPASCTQACYLYIGHHQVQSPSYIPRWHSGRRSHLTEHRCPRTEPSTGNRLVTASASVSMFLSVNVLSRMGFPVPKQSVMPRYRFLLPVPPVVVDALQASVNWPLVPGYVPATTQ